MTFTVTPKASLIDDINKYVTVRTLSPSHGLSHWSVSMARQASKVMKNNGGPVDAKNKFLTIIRTHWDAHPVAEKQVADLITYYGAAIYGNGTKADGLLNAKDTKFVPRQLLKHLSFDAAFLMCCTATSDEFVESCLASMVGVGSFTTWIGGKNFDRTVIRNHIDKHWPETAAAPVSAPTVDLAELQSETEVTNQIIKESDTMTNTATAAPVAALPSNMKPVIDAVLSSSGITDGIEALLSAMARVRQVEAMSTKLTDATKEAMAQVKLRDDEIDSLNRKLVQAKATANVYAMPASAAGIPKGASKTVKASTLFPILATCDFDIPAWDWDHTHPDVPAISLGYIFRKEMLVKFLRCLKSGDNAWFQGHTGSGKTTFVEQVAARLQWPVARIAFDSSIDRSELVGRMQLHGDGKGGTISEWLAGVLELAIPNGYILLCDEFDAGRPDALYVMQEILEHKAKRLLEDGGRFINYHPMSRVVATGNTCGSGDPSGIYPATRILSGATLDRFPVFIHVPYMTEAEEATLISSHTSLDKKLVARMAKFATEMRQAFVKSEIPISYSPRRSIAFARATEDFANILVTKGGAYTHVHAMSLAFQQAVYDAAPEEFKQRIVEVARAALDGSLDPNFSLN